LEPQNRDKIQVTSKAHMQALFGIINCVTTGSPEISGTFVVKIVGAQLWACASLSQPIRNPGNPDNQWKGRESRGPRK